MDRNRRFEGKVALVTGGANGIGKAAALGFSREGASVVIADMDVQSGEALVKSMHESGRNALFVKTDVRDEAQIVNMIARTKEAFGRLDVAHNNAGGGGGPSARSITEMSREVWDNGIAHNLTSVWMSLKYEIPLIKESGGGAIVNTSSTAGVRMSPMSAVYYGAAKAGILHLTRIAAILHAPDKIRVNSVTPGPTGTPAFSRLPEAEVDKLLMKSLIKRVNTTEEVANAVLWLCSEEAAMTTGANIGVDGGNTIS